MVSFLTGMGLLREPGPKAAHIFAWNGTFAFVGVPRQCLFWSEWSLCSHRVSEQVFFWLPWDFWPLTADKIVESPQHSLAFFSLWDCTGGKRAESGGKQAGDWKRVRQKSQDGVFFNRNGAFAGTVSRDG